MSLPSPRDPMALAGRRQFLTLGVGALLGLGGCGFQPLYRTPVSGSGQAATAGQALDQIDIAPIADRKGQILRNYLVQALNHNGRPLRPDYRLTANLTERRSRLAIKSDSAATRANLTITVNYVLTRTGGGIETRGTTRVVTSYNILRDEFGTLSSERSARDRALRQTSQDIRSRLALALIKRENVEPGE